MVQASHAWDLLRASVLHYMRASTPGEFTEEKRQQARNFLLDYAHILQGPTMPAEQQLTNEPEDSGFDSDGGEQGASAATKSAEALGGDTAPAAEATLVSTFVLGCHSCLCLAMLTVTLLVRAFLHCRRHCKRDMQRCWQD